MPDFHRDWMNKGYIKAQDFNINILMNPPHYRIDNLPEQFKEKIITKYQKHIDYISPLDSLQRATNGYKSAINFIKQTGDGVMLDQFITLTDQLDKIRGENFGKTFPEFNFKTGQSWH
jgi:hypothetical protein